MKTTNVITKFILLIVAVFLLSLIFAFVDAYPDYPPAYEMGRLTASIFKHAVKLLGMIALLFIAIRLFKKK